MSADANSEAFRRLLARFLVVVASASLAACGPRANAREAVSVATTGVSGQVRARCPLGDPDDPLCAINQVFRRAYAGVQQSIQKTSGPVIISRFDEVILVRDGREVDRKKTIAERYHRLKAVAHVPLAVHLLLYPDAGRPLNEETRAALKELRELIAEAGPSARLGLSAEQSARQQTILAAADGFIESALAAGQVSAADLRAYTRGAADDVLANARDAAESQLANLHGHVTGWLAEMSPERRERLSVVVQVGHMPRIGSLTSQYFSALLGEPYEGRFDVENVSADPKVIVAEGRGKDERLLKLLQTHAIDARIGVDFFDDDERMHRDLLADATEEWLRRTLDAQPSTDKAP